MIREIEEIRETDPPKLTRYPQGSLRELFTISFPLILAVFSSHFMIFFDRLVLSHYALDAMNAAAAAEMISMIFSYGLVSIVSVAELFVRGLYQAKKYTKIAEPVWQMIWLACILWPLYYSIAQYAGPYLLTNYFYEDYGLPYFQWILYFGPSQAIQVALCAFFIGIGRMRLVLLSIFISNICNVILDLVLIFGIEGVLDPMDTKGAALATGISETIQVLFLFIPFLQKGYRHLYRTHLPSFNPALLFKCFRVAFPCALGSMVEISAWSFMMPFMVRLGSLHTAVLTMGLAFYSLVAFSVEGMQKGVMAIAASLIPARKWDELKRLWWSAVKMLFGIMCVSGLVLVIYPDPLIREFLVRVPLEEQPLLFETMKQTCFFIWFYLLFEGFVWISAGILMALGDQVFVNVSNAIIAWGFALFPLYFFIYRTDMPPASIWQLLAFYAAVHAACFFYRYKSERHQLQPHWDMLEA